VPETTAHAPCVQSTELLYAGLQGSKNPGFFKQPNPVGFIGFLGFIGFWGFIGFFEEAGQIGKIIQKLSNLKP